MVCSRCRWFVVDVVGKTNLRQNKAEIFWRWYWSSSFWPCSNRIFKQIVRTKASDLMHIFIDISWFSTKLDLPFTQCLHCADHHAMNDARVNLWQCLVKRVIVDILLWTFNFFVAYVLLILRKVNIEKEWTFRFVCHFLKELRVGDERSWIRFNNSYTSVY